MLQSQTTDQPIVTRGRDTRTQTGKHIHTHTHTHTYEIYKQSA